MDTQFTPQQPSTFIDNPADIEYSPHSKSRFLFVLGFFCYFIFAWAGCYNLYTHKFVPNNDVKVPESTTYNPTYK
ncbi:MAG: hypothetical protein ABI169_07655 [Chitinophagaceae bacterium]